MGSALSRMRIRVMFSVWRPWVDRTASSAQQMLALEKQSANQRRVHLGAMIIATTVRERERSSINGAFDCLLRALAEARRRVAAGSDSKQGQNGVNKLPHENTKSACGTLQGPERLLARR